jgi:hypothetical protein
LELALTEGEAFGIWGGTSERERRVQKQFTIKECDRLSDYDRALTGAWDFAGEKAASFCR